MKYILWIYITSIVFLDRFTKYLAETQLNSPIHLASDFLQLRLGYNSGIAFGLPIEWNFLDVLTLLIITGVIVYASKYDPLRFNRIVQWWYASVIAWAFWNAYDRIVYDRVVDFIDLKYFAIFNVADIVICIGAVLLFYAHSKIKP